MTDDLSQTLGRNIPLSEMIQTLRTELQASFYAANDQDLRFRVESIELELKISVTRETKGGGGVKFWVLNAEGAHKAGHEDVHTFRLKLQPVGAGRLSGQEEILVRDTVAELPK